MMTNRDEVARNVAKKYDVCFEAMCPKCQDALISSESERDLARETTEAYAAERDRFIELAAENGVRADKAEARVEELEKEFDCAAEFQERAEKADARVEKLQEALRKIAALALGDYSGRAIARAALSAKEKVNESK